MYFNLQKKYFAYCISTLFKFNDCFEKKTQIAYYFMKLNNNK